jgi:hypothetical protein
MAVDPGAMTGGSIAIGQTAFFYSAFMPRLTDVRKASSMDGDMRGDVLLGQVAAGGASLLIGVLVTWVTGSQVPLIVTVLLALFIGAVYQFALNGNRVMES